jgi:hypothetical protein
VAKIPETVVGSFADLHEVLSRYPKPDWIFRGHSEASWRLLPKIGRPPFSRIEEEDIFTAWKRRAVEFVEPIPRDDWDWLTIAQHHGLATRLLDWSFNPLAAAFFAVHEEVDSPAHIYALNYGASIVDQSQEPDPLKYIGVGIFRPSAVARRISHQGGVFTVHGPPSIPLQKALADDQKIERVIIEKSYRGELLRELDHYGVNRVSLFPDLDGLSEYINWFMKDPKEV